MHPTVTVPHLDREISLESCRHSSIKVKVVSSNNHLIVLAHAGGQTFHNPAFLELAKENRLHKTITLIRPRNLYKAIRLTILSIEWTASKQDLWTWELHLTRRKLRDWNRLKDIRKKRISHPTFLPRSRKPLHPRKLQCLLLAGDMDLKNF